MIANATGLEPDICGMHRPAATFNEFAQRVTQILDSREHGGILSRTGVVERIIPAEGPHVQPVWFFVVVRIRNELQRVFMNSMSGLGNLVDERSPLGSAAGAHLPPSPTGKSTVGIFYTPYHYVAIQAPISITMAVIDRQVTIAPLTNGKRYADVMALTKKDLLEGEVIDEIGGLCVAGRVEKARIVSRGNFLLFALARGASMKRAVSKASTSPMTMWCSISRMTASWHSAVNRTSCFPLPYRAEMRSKPLVRALIVHKRPATLPATNGWTRPKGRSSLAPSTHEKGPITY
ncbi:hypothetical protein [Acidisoma sp. S159]|uniref:hypothetical protein n=1 Tax=Acidisoma sp. S159 TaxID=1747225 RepID=UPI00131CED81|nr:hypothetical protein [Acidisoma sp. S159]